MDNNKFQDLSIAGFEDLSDTEAGKLNGGDKFIFNPYSFAAPYGFIGPGFGSPGFGAPGFGSNLGGGGATANASSNSNSNSNSNSRGNGRGRKNKY